MQNIIKFIIYTCMFLFVSFWIGLLILNFNESNYFKKIEHTSDVMDQKCFCMKKNKNCQIKDIWGVEIKVEKLEKDFRFQSCGQDKICNNEDDIEKEIEIEKCK